MAGKYAFLPFLLNMDNRTTFIKSTEELHLTTLYSYCRNLFEGHKLPSHDHDHHLRVWHYTREMITLLPQELREFSINDIEQLMLAVFFHDTGLTVTLSEDHGSESAGILKRFLDHNQSAFPADSATAISAVEQHDKKEIPDPGDNDPVPGIPIIVSLCDDLDAYGPAGILRYAEIYLLRGISFAGLPERVLKNLKLRFRRFAHQKWIPVDLVAKHEKRYNYTREFYETMQQQNAVQQKEIIRCYMDYHGTTEGSLRGFALKLVTGKNEVFRNFGNALLADLGSEHHCSP